MDWQLVLLGVIAFFLFHIGRRLDWILDEMKKNNGWLERLRDGQETARDNQRETIGLLEKIERGRR
jgi:hypothetical protein